MELNYFKDMLFDLLNESDELDLSDIRADDKRDTFILHTADGSVFELLCQKMKRNRPRSRGLSYIIFTISFFSRAMVRFSSREM